MTLDWLSPLVRFHAWAANGGGENERQSGTNHPTFFGLLGDSEEAGQQRVDREKADYPSVMTFQRCDTISRLTRSACVPKQTSRKKVAHQRH